MELHVTDVLPSTHLELAVDCFRALASLLSASASEMYTLVVLHSFTNSFLSLDLMSRSVLPVLIAVGANQAVRPTFSILVMCEPHSFGIFCVAGCSIWCKMAVVVECAIKRCPF
ncbi:Uncharacterised protein r2_g855 [Pycnogonum litorale]